MEERINGQPDGHRPADPHGTGCGPFPKLASEARTAVNTACAAWHLNRRPQTLRCWAAYEDGPLRPTRINGRLAWKTADLRNLLGVAE